AVDKNGADITSSIKVTSNNVNASKTGNYTVTYEVTDSEGNTANKTVTVTVKERSEADKPVITAADKEIYVNSKFDPLEGVTAVDKNGADITSSIKVTNNVNTSKPGRYTVTYEVTDSEGNTANKTVTVTVKDKEVPNYHGTITANDFTVKQDSYIKGTYTGDVSKISVIINGKEQMKI
ncbi:DUF5011 domain-containing protein, partial [Enterococcus faecalis]|nr:DUF5011 domain-containing protein [Enterococcus faecalis]